MRPGQVGTLVDFKANPLDVTATIVDLAVRGYLKIEELSEGGLLRKGDWKLTRMKEDDAELMPYEQKLLDGLFRDDPEVQLSDLRYTFAGAHDRGAHRAPERREGTRLVRGAWRARKLRVRRVSASWCS